MKKSIKLTVVLLMSITVAYAQQLKPNETIKGHIDSFIVKQPTPGKSIYAFNSKNSYYKKNPKTAPSDISTVTRADKTGMLDAFMQVFSDARIKQLLPEGRMIIQSYVNPEGKILEMVFYFLNNGTLVTAAELEDLEKAIKTNVTYKLLPEETKGGDFFLVTEMVKYDKVLDRTQK